jgi:hypothetical protein
VEKNIGTRPKQNSWYTLVISSLGRCDYVVHFYEDKLQDVIVKSFTDTNKSSLLRITKKNAHSWQDVIFFLRQKATI